MCFAYTIVWTVYVHIGGCRHVYYLPVHTQELALKLNWISQVFCIWSIIFGKVSVALLILRLGPRDKLRRGLLYSAGGSITILFGLQTIFVFAQCRPSKALWTFGIAAKCWDPRVVTYLAMIETGSLSCKNHHVYVLLTQGQPIARFLTSLFLLSHFR